MWGQLTFMFSSLLLGWLLCCGFLPTFALHERSIRSCPPLKRPRLSAPSSVHDLRVDDIRVVMGLGDSITAGFGARGWLSGLPLSEDRGVSFSIGGDPGAATLPNFIRHFVDDEESLAVHRQFSEQAFSVESQEEQWEKDISSSSRLVGASVGRHLVHICYGKICSPWSKYEYRPDKDVFNAAVSGAEAMNLQLELDYLIARVNSDPRVNVAKDFKLLTLMIGGNDVCHLGCLYTNDTQSQLLPRQYESYLRLAIERIRAELPRTIVQLIPMFNVSSLYHLVSPHARCTIAAPYECKCIFNRDPIQGDRLREQTDALIQAFNQAQDRIVKSYQSVERDPDFAVVMQPMFRQMNLLKFDMSHVSEIDCFHPTVKSHGAMARALWHNMYLHPNKKKVDFDPNDKTVYCPTEEDRIWTY